MDNGINKSKRILSLRQANDDHHDDDDHEYYQEHTCVNTGAENITNKLTPRQKKSEACEKKKCGILYHNRSVFLLPLQPQAVTGQ
jgi:hypothetical protein